MSSFAEYHNKRNKTKINLDNNIVDINIEDEKEEESPFMKYHNEREKQEYEKKLRKQEYDDEEDTDTWFKKGAFDDGWQPGDLIKTVGSTVGDIGVGLGKGIFRLGEGVGDLISYGVADIQEWTGNEEAAEATRERTRQSVTDEIFQPAEDFVDKNSVLGDKSDSITEGLGYVAGITAISVVSGGAGSALGVSSTAAATVGSTAATFTSAMGSGMSEALNDGATIDEARIYGAISGAGEAASELLFGGLGKASGALGLSKGIGELDDIVATGLTKKIKNKLVKTAIQSGVKASAEGLEEIVSGLISSAGKKLTYMDEKEYSEIVKDENLAEQFWMGALTSAIAQGPSTIKSVKSGTDYISGKTSNEQKVYDNEVKTRTSEKVRQATIEEAYNKEIKTKENLGIKITEEVKAEAMKKVENAYDSGKLESIKLSKKELGNIEEQVQKDMEDGNITSESIMKTLGENQDISKDNLLMRSMYENEQKYNSYKVEKTDNEKVNVLMQSAADAGMNNTSKTRKKVELIAKITKDTDRQYKFVSPEQLKEMGYNENANGLINKETGEILINAHSDKGIQSIVGHETTHIFDNKDAKRTYSKEYQTLQDTAVEYAKAKGIYDSKVESITNAYGDLLTDESQIKEELTADLVGDFLFNDEKFIENLAVKDRNVFQKIYDYIKHTYKMMRGTDEEKAFENLKHQFEKVYKTIDTKTDSSTDVKYHISENFSNEIDKSLKGEIPSNDQVKARDYTPQILVNNGVKDLPMLITQKHIKSTIYTLQEAEKLGLPTKNVNYHGLGKDLLIKAIDNLDNPQSIYKTRENNYLVVTEFKDNNGKEIIVPIQIDGKGIYNDVYIDENQVKSVYGKNNLEEYLKNNNFEQIYKKEASTLNEGIQYSDISNNASNNSIASKNKDVNTTKYSMQESENNSNSYSLTNDNHITGDDIAVRDMLKQERPTIEDEIGKTTEEIKTEAPTVEQVITQTEEQKQQGMKEKAKKYLSRSKTKFINKIVDDFGTSKLANTKTLNTVVDRIREDIQNNGPLTKKKADSYFNELYNNLVTIDTLYYDTYKEVKDNIRQTKMYISDDIKNDMTDYNEFRKNNMGTLIMTSDNSNLGVDSYYQELNELYPELFPEDIINPTDQLEKISEVAKDISKVEMNVAAYNDKYMGEDYREWARAEFDKDINDFMQDIKLADRYNSDTNEKITYGADKETVKAAYKQIPDARKTYEKIMAKELLTKEDRVQVDRLLNNEITLQEIPNGLNKKGIVNVAQAKLEYDTLQKVIKEYQDDIKSSRIEQAKKDVGDLNLWKDKKTGFRYSRETPIRNIYDIAPKNVADNVANKYFRSYIETNEKKVVDAINGYNDRIKSLDIGTKNKYKITYENETKTVSESALIQLLGEKKITAEDVKKSGANVTKIENAVKEFRNIYNELITQVNESMLDNGYAPMEYRKDYFPHFTEEKADTLLGKAAKLLGIDITNREELPTDIAGQTYQFKPGRTWFSNMLQRTTDATDYDALKGFDKYVRGATDLIYHTGDIQNLRALSTAIRGTYNDTEIQNRIEEIKESTMSDLDKSIAIQDIYEKAKDKSHLSKFVEWLDNYTNLLAGKKAINDRGAEKELNRQMYKTMQDVESRIAANAIGGNIGVSLTNFAPISQAWGEVKTHNLINGVWQTMKASLGKDTSFASESQFITRRRGADTLVETTLEKVTKPLNSVLEFADKFTSEVIVRARYNQNLQQGMSQELALQEADRYAAGLMADRGRGALPTQFSNKNPISKMINMFQVEVNNQWSYYLKDLPKNIQERANNNKAKIVSNTAMAYTKIMVGSYLVNELLGSIRGKSTRVLPDPIYIIKELLKGLTDDDDDNDDDVVIQTLTEIAGNIPFVSLPATLVADSLGLDVGDIGRIPISGSIPNIADITKDLLDSDMTAGEKVKNIGGELADTVGASLILPYGGSQIKKTVKGLSMYANDIPGSYTDKGDLRYTVDEDVGSKVQAALFGAYANPYAQDYIDSGYKAIKQENIDEMVGLDMNSTEYREFKSNMSKVSDTSDKNGYKQYTDENNNVYWYDANSETMYDSKYKKTTLTEDDLIKVSKKEQALNYINSLDLTTAQKNLAANNLNKNSKKKIDMAEYGNYDSYDEYQYARDYPEKYNVIKQIGSFDEYNEYYDAISEISKKYKELNEDATDKEKTRNSKYKKQEIQSYINGLDLNMYQKMMLEKMAGGYSIKKYRNYIYEYLESTELSDSEKYTIWEELFE